MAAIQLRLMLRGFTTTIGAHTWNKNVIKRCRIIQIAILKRSDTRTQLSSLITLYGSHDSLINDLWPCQTSSEPNLLEKRFEGIRGVCERDRQTETTTNLHIETCVPTRFIMFIKWVGDPIPITNPFTIKV